MWLMSAPKAIELYFMIPDFVVQSFKLLVKHETILLQLVP